MKTMKGLNMNRMFGSLKRKPNANDANVGSNSDANSANGSPEAHLDTPEANATRSVRLFCESGGPNGSGDEVLYLPTIVESCESSPAAAKEACYMIRKFLSKDNFSKPYVQYNGIMLVRILADNPGKTFTRNIDGKFVTTIKELLRVGRDPSVKQILIETLDTFQREKVNDEGLSGLNEMWKKEQEKMAKAYGPAGNRTLVGPPFDSNAQNYFSRNHNSRRLPPPHELSSRIEEARTSAGLLSQVVQSTPPSEVIQNELVREFADRCQSASRSIQAYMIAEDPAPDNDTMETLIETNEQLSKAMSQHQRAVLHARKVLGFGSGESGNTPPSDPTGNYAAPPGPPPGRSPARPSNTAAPIAAPPTLSQPMPARKNLPMVPPPGDYAPTGSDDEKPFRDAALSGKKASSPPLSQDKPQQNSTQFNDRLGVEPYHPGFKETQSYIGRQNSAVGNLTMHAAIPDTPLEEEEEPASASNAPGKQPVYRY